MLIKIARPNRFVQLLAKCTPIVCLLENKLNRQMYLFIWKNHVHTISNPGLFLRLLRDLRVLFLQCLRAAAVIPLSPPRAEPPSPHPTHYGYVFTVWVCVYNFDQLCKHILKNSFEGRV